MSQLPRICMIIERYTPLIGGSETQCRLLCHGLRTAGVPVFILTRRIDKHTSKRTQVDGTAVFRLPPSGVGRIVKELGFAWTSARELVRRRNDFDIVHLHSGTSVAGALAVLVAHWLKKKVLVKVATAGDITKHFIETTAEGLRKPGLTHRIVNRLINHQLRRADRIICISREIKEELRANKFDETRLTLLPNAVDTRRFAPVTAERRQVLRQQLGLPQTSTLFLYTGRLILRKGVDLLIAAWPDVQRRNPQTTLVILGSGSSSLDSMETVLRERVRQDGLSSSILFVGEQANVSDYLQTCDIFVFPSRREGLSNALLEAMSCQLPIVASAIGGTTDLITDNRNGLLFQSESVSQLADRLNQILSDPNQRQQIAAQARRTAEGYSLELLAPKLIAVYTKLLFA